MPSPTQHRGSALLHAFHPQPLRCKPGSLCYICLSHTFYPFWGDNAISSFAQWIWWLLMIYGKCSETVWIRNECGKSWFCCGYFPVMTVLFLNVSQQKEWKLLGWCDLQEASLCLQLMFYMPMSIPDYESFLKLIICSCNPACSPFLSRVKTTFIWHLIFCWSLNIAQFTKQPALTWDFMEKKKKTHTQFLKCTISKSKELHLRKPFYLPF